MELTKEYFDSQIQALNNRMDGFATKDDLLELPTKQDFIAGKSSIDDKKELRE